ncbi:MAG: magnesium transporter CorA family protein [Eubacterium sp.]|nr:magnesium transporter CorA family protein [Eubacterium sp.]MBQ9022876.1 magnesium transporter CorA family protein [Eubacterium sp.]
MVKIYMTDDRVVYELEERREGAWIMLTNPTVEELQEVARDEIDIADLRAALDDEESSRIELEDGYTLILVDIPTTEIRNELKTYTTIPLGIILTQENIITVCTEETPILTQFVNKRVRDFSTKKKMRFIYQILFRTAASYQSTLRIIDKQRTEIEEEIGDMTEDKDLFQLHELESTLVYFATSLRANAVVLERLTRYKRLEQFPEDMELLEDVIVENQQAVEMTTIYKDILIGTRELLSAVLNNRLNNVMKYLTTITLVMAVPTVVSGLFGMNVPVPLANNAFGFASIAICTFIVCIIVLILLKRKRML